MQVHMPVRQKVETTNEGRGVGDGVGVGGGGVRGGNEPKRET